MMSKHKKYSRWISKRLKAHILARDENKCQICGATSELCLSRKIPGSLGGLPIAENLQVLCRDCVAIKGNLIISNEQLQVYITLYEAQWHTDEKRHRIGRIHSMIRYGLSERAKSTPTNDWTNGQDMERTKNDVLHSLRERHKAFLNRK